MTKLSAGIQKLEPTSKAGNRTALGRDSDPVRRQAAPRRGDLHHRGRGVDPAHLRAVRERQSTEVAAAAADVQQSYPRLQLHAPAIACRAGSASAPQCSAKVAASSFHTSIWLRPSHAALSRSPHKVRHILDQAPVRLVTPLPESLGDPPCSAFSPPPSSPPPHF